MPRRPTVKKRWTLVQHSGAGYGDKPGFEKGVEIREVEKLADQTLVLKVGGKLYDSWEEANAEEDKLNLSGPTIYPEAPGTFSEKVIDGLKIYIPK